MVTILHAAQAIPFLLYGAYVLGGLGIGALAVKLYDKHHYGPDGYNGDGYDRAGRDRQGLDKDGYDQDGYDIDGFNKHGKDRDGYNKSGYKDGFDRDGLDTSGYAVDGFNPSGIDRAGNDRMYYAGVVKNIDERIRNAYKQRGHEHRNHEYALLEVRTGLEMGAKALYIHYSGSTADNLKFARLLDLSKRHLDDDLHDKLKSAYSICSQGLHDGKQQNKSVSSVTFCIKTLEELRDAIKDLSQPVSDSTTSN